MTRPVAPPISPPAIMPAATSSFCPPIIPPITPPTIAPRRVPSWRNDCASTVDVVSIAVQTSEKIPIRNNIDISSNAVRAAIGYSDIKKYVTLGDLSRLLCESLTKILPLSGQSLPTISFVAVRLIVWSNIWNGYKVLSIAETGIVGIRSRPNHHNFWGD